MLKGRDASFCDLGIEWEAQRRWGCKRRKAEELPAIFLFWLTLDD
jgi:hypothetical protein